MPITQQGVKYATSMSGVGMGVQDNIFRQPVASFGDTSTVADVPSDKNSGENTTGKKWLFTLVGVLAFLVILKFAGEHEKSGMNPEIVGVGVWNWVTTGLLATSFIVVMKVILNKWHVIGASDYINAV